MESDRVHLAVGLDHQSSDTRDEGALVEAKKQGDRSGRDSGSGSEKIGRLTAMEVPEMTEYERARWRGCFHQAQRRLEHREHSD
jgi:hypothetical protein